VPAADIEGNWQKLLSKAKQRDGELVITKQKFTEVTRAQIRKFQEDVAQFRERFDLTGPGAPDMDLDDGLNAMKVRVPLPPCARNAHPHLPIVAAVRTHALQSFRNELKQLVKERDQLLLTEKLFDLEPASFSDLYYVEDEMNKLAQLYDLYTKQKESVKKWSNMLWAELEVSLCWSLRLLVARRLLAACLFLQIGTLTHGIASYTKQMQRMPAPLKKSPVFKRLQNKINGFKESIPQIQNLKSDALRKRHWADLMKLTKVRFACTALESARSELSLNLDTGQL
jgi:dynein heavy chain